MSLPQEVKVKKPLSAEGIIWSEKGVTNGVRS